jgi:hypothetical protein
MGGIRRLAKIASTVGMFVYNDDFFCYGPGIHGDHGYG